ASRNNPSTPQRQSVSPAASSARTLTPRSGPTAAASRSPVAVPSPINRFATDSAVCSPAAYGFSHTPIDVGTSTVTSNGDAASTSASTTEASTSPHTLHGSEAADG